MPHRKTIGVLMDYHIPGVMQTGGLSVAQVAEIVGFSSVHYFTTAFKREVGETPGVYRAGSG